MKKNKGGDVVVTKRPILDEQGRLPEMIPKLEVEG